MEITDVEARCSGSSGGGDASGLDPSPVETARALSRGQPPVPRRRRHRQKRKVFWKASAVLALCAVGVTYAHGPGAVDALRSALTHTPARRRLGAKKSICKSVYEKVHPNANKVRGRGYSDGEKEKKRGGGGCNAARKSFGIFAVSVVCVIYLFVGIAIVCDELFVPSLEQIAEDWGLSDDVSGATLMAAGGSAPELATSFIGTFQGSTVGLGTIVGSAVFNVLFVIGMCALATPKELGPLKLTWWPLARDCCYYILTLGTLASFFTTTSTGLITGAEAGIQFSLYFGYVFLMSQNAKLESWVKRKLAKEERYKVSPGDAAADPSDGEAKEEHTTFSAGFLGNLTHADLKMNAGIAVVARIKGDVRATFDSLDADRNGSLDAGEFRKILGLLGDATSYDETELEALRKELDIDHSNTIDFKEFTLWYISSESRLRAETKKAFDQFDLDKSGAVDVAEVREVVRSLTAANALLADRVDGAVDDFVAVLAGKEQASYDEFQRWYEGTPFWVAQKQEADEVQEAATGMRAAVAASLRDLTTASPGDALATVLLLPLNGSLALTVPDCRVIGNEHYCYLSFVCSIAWIGAYSFGMVECIVSIGCFTGIPIFIMGLTFLAAGTSVPDLLSSVAVAKQGKGDMAVSSSIGSNIFDVAVGLPLPWLAFTLVHGCPVPVGGHANGNALSVAILLAMVAAVIISIAASGWKMSKGLGFTMFGLYFLFIAQELFRNYA
ncbi:calcium, potassium:sodium antiporter [Aureococcus anophagefferens]|uniref:Calcium, potassium:sodium antiporter n=1 Tax=Aureococcus anophagefferens TaxID=44056 RepID=A0ABR1FGU0_AURAN